MRLMTVYAAFLLAVPVFAQTTKPTTTPTRSTTPTPQIAPPLTTKVYFHSRHPACVITGASLGEGEYQVTIPVTLGGIKNTITTKGYAHYATMDGQTYTHIFVDYPLQDNGPCPSLTFAK